MLTIWKFPIPTSAMIWTNGKFKLEMPQDARILCLQVQGDTPCLWAELQSENPPEQRQFAIIGTGHPAPPAATYVGTWQEESFVWHLYERAQ